MKMFDVYPVYPISVSRANGCRVYDEEGQEYLDFYGGHAVISIGHAHPHYLRRITDQLNRIGFYSNSVEIPLQGELADKLGEMSGYPDYQLFLCNSGAEAVENALKLASFHTGRPGIVCFENAFHGRTSLAVSVTDAEAIQAPVNRSEFVHRVKSGDLQAVESLMKSGDIAAVILEGIQGIGGIYEPDGDFLQGLRDLCSRYGSVLVLDEIQSGFGRSGRFFAHQWHEVQADIITMAKGMGNGFPVGGILISPDIPPKHGMLGTTFGGNHLACAAVLGVLEVMKNEDLTGNARETGRYLRRELEKIDEIEEVRGRGLMIGADLPFDIKEMRKKLLLDHKIFTGSARNPRTLRLLPPLNAGREECDRFMVGLKKVLQ